MTVADGTASAHDNPIPARAWTDEWPRHAAAAPCIRAGSTRADMRTRHLHRVRAACGRSVSVACHRAPPARDAAGVPLRTHPPASPRRLPSFPPQPPFQPFLPARAARTGKMRAFAARTGRQTVRAQTTDRALQLYRPSYPRYYNPPIAGQ